MPQLLAGFANAAWDSGILLSESCQCTRASWSFLPVGGSNPALPWPWGCLPRRLLPHSASTHPAPERKSTVPTVRKRKGGCFPHAAQPCRGAQQSQPSWLGLCAWRGGGAAAGSLCTAVVCAPVRAFLPWEGFHVLPRRRQGGKDTSPAKSPADRCLAACFFRRRR